jgi:hypothetical protein
LKLPIGFKQVEYLEVDEFTDVVNSVEQLCVALDRALENPKLWKDIILTSHATLQGTCVCILTRTDGTGALAKGNQKALMHKLYGEVNGSRNLDDDSVDWPEDFIADLPELLKRLPNGLAVSLPGRKADYGYDAAGDLRRLHEFRNKFVHFSPTSWSLELAGLPRVVSNALILAKQITVSNAYKRWNRFKDTEVERMLDEALDKLMQIEKVFNSSLGGARP